MKVLIPINNYTYFIDDPKNDISSLIAWKSKWGSIPDFKSQPAFKLNRGGFCLLDNGGILKIKKITLNLNERCKINISGSFFDPAKRVVEKLVHSFPASRISPLLV